MGRPDGRAPDQMRPVTIETGISIYAEGSVLISFGNTKVICMASVEERVPPHKKGTGEGWVTAEYSMLPRATAARTPRDIVAGRQPGRSQEIQRLIGRSLRAAVDLSLLGERTITIDCDVLQADGGTRTASITGGYVALKLATDRMVKEGIIEKSPIVHQVAAVNVGIVDGEVLLDLNYLEDFQAQTDMNCVMNDELAFIEIQATAEHMHFTREQLDQMLKLAQKGIEELFELQRNALG